MLKYFWHLVRIYNLVLSLQIEICIEITGILSMEKIIEENYQRALKYVDYEQNIVDYITKIFTENGLLAL